MLAGDVLLACDRSLAGLDDRVVQRGGRAPGDDGGADHERDGAGTFALDHGHARRALGWLLPAFVALDPDPDLAAAGEADVPGLIVGDAVVEELRRPTAEHRARLLDDGALDAASRDRSGDLSAL